ncbi:uncharacterized protein [Antedon mediterranea]|uniref:uncharacterized protein n=1 Tax=Antedon mediterranea TaxID=105859 RepID=UPI003AF6BDCF
MPTRSVLFCWWRSSACVLSFFPNKLKSTYTACTQFRVENRLKMRYVAAYLLATLGGNNNPNAKDIKKILASVGIDAEEDKLDRVIEELQGKDINEVIAEGQSKLASVPSGGGAASGGGGGAAAGGGGGEAAAEEKKEEKKEESEESDDDMGFGLFD